VVTFPLTKHRHTLHCWVTGSSVNNVPNVIVWQLITSQSWLTPHCTGLNTVRYSCWFNRFQPSPAHNTQPMSRTLTQWPMVSSKATVGSAGLSNERRNTPSIRLSPKSSASQLLSSLRSAWACSGRPLASYKPTQHGHPSVGWWNSNYNIGSCKPSSYSCSSSGCHGTLLHWLYTDLFIIIIIIITIITVYLNTYVRVSAVMNACMK